MSLGGQCFVCREKLTPAFQGDSTQHCATAFYASGNYGSGVFDPSNSRLQLKINICDNCMLLNKELVVQVRKKFQIPVSEYTPWNPEEESG